MMQGKYSKKWRTSNPLKSRYSQMKMQCKHQGVELALEYEQMCAFFPEQTACYYCGGPNTTNGLDRVDNNRGFSLDNCIPSCKVCNNLKRSSTLEAFLERAVRLKDRKPSYLLIANRFKDKTLQQVREEIQQIQQRAFALWQQSITLLSDKEDTNMSNSSRKPAKIEIPRRANPNAPTFIMSAKVTYPDLSKIDWKAETDTRDPEEDITIECARTKCPSYMRIMGLSAEDNFSKTPSNTSQDVFKQRATERNQDCTQANL
jgi:hypothetical protein